MTTTTETPAITNANTLTVLQMAANGDTLLEIAAKLEMHIQGVHYHVRKAREATGTENIVHAVAAALRMGLID